MSELWMRTHSIAAEMDWGRQRKRWEALVAGPNCALRNL